MEIKGANQDSGIYTYDLGMKFEGLVVPLTAGPTFPEGPFAWQALGIKGVPCANKSLSILSSFASVYTLSPVKEWRHSIET